MESEIHSVPGATGAIYAVRRSLFTPLPAGTILDDVVVPMRIVLGGHRAVFDPAARAYDAVSGRRGMRIPQEKAHAHRQLPADCRNAGAAVLSARIHFHAICFP